jgi:hypothetical protein
MPMLRLGNKTMNEEIGGNLKDDGENGVSGGWCNGDEHDGEMKKARKRKKMNDDYGLYHDHDHDDHDYGAENDDDHPIALGIGRSTSIYVHSNWNHCHQIQLYLDLRHCSNGAIVLDKDWQRKMKSWLRPSLI